MILRTAAEAFSANPTLKIAVFGHTGSGKTHWAARSPRPLIFVKEPQAMASIRLANPQAHVIEMTTPGVFHKAWEEIKKAPVGEVDGQPCIMVDGHPIQTIVVDSVTDLQAMIKAKLVDRSGSYSASNLDLDTEALTMQNWGRMNDAILEVLRDQRALPCNTVFIFLASDTQNDQGQRIVGPLLEGKQVPPMVGSFFNAMGYAMRMGDKYRTKWRASDDLTPCKPMSGWPDYTQNLERKGCTTLGSLLQFTYPDDSVASVDGDNGEIVLRQTKEYKEKAKASK